MTARPAVKRAEPARERPAAIGTDRIGQGQHDDEDGKCEHDGPGLHAPESSEARLSAG